MDLLDNEVGRRLRGRTGAVLVVGLAVAVAVWRISVRIDGSSRMQYSDYWPMLDSLINDDTSIRWKSFLEARNGHPIVMGKFLYLLNVWIADGSNWTQAVIVVVLALLIIVTVLFLVRGTDGLGRWGRVAVAVFAVFAVFAPAGGWTYIKAMSGTAWLSANLFFVAALVFQQRDRKALTFASATVATISYGTALAVWPALAVAGLLRHGKRWQEQWPIWSGGLIAGALYLRWRLENPVKSASGDAASIVERSLLLTTEKFLPFGRYRWHVLLLMVLLMVGVWALWSVRERLSATAPWVGMVVYGVVATIMIARTRTIEEGLDASRYWSVSMWIWLGFFAVVVLATRGRPWQPVAIVALSWAILWQGTVSDYSLRTASETNDVLAVAVYLDLAEGNKVAGGFHPFPPVTDKLRRMGHYPFDGNLHVGCGLVGQKVRLDPEPPDGFASRVELDPLKESPTISHFSGTVDAPGESIQCVVVVDEAGTVVGSGIHRVRWNGSDYLRAVGPAEGVLTVAVRPEPDGPFFAVTEPTVVNVESG